MPLLGHGHHHHQRSQEAQQEQRDAKRVLKERIRSDWDYPTLPAFQSTGRRRRRGDEGGAAVAAPPGGFRYHAPNAHGGSRGDGGRDGLGFEAVAWRERECTSGSDSDGDGSVVSTGSKGSSHSKKSRFTFDGPESVGAQLARRSLAHKRKRLRDLSDEMGWNEGLAHWMSRRDAWSGAHTAAQVRAIESHPRDLPATSAGSTSTGSTPRTSTSSTASQPLQSSTAATSPDLTQSSASAATSPSDLLIPLAPPVLPNHPIRRRISPNMYTEIYSKIILQSRTPSIPINLATLINALVKGWKDDGEWPPKPGVLEPNIAKRRSKGEEGGLRSGVKAVARVLRLTGTAEAK